MTTIKNSEYIAKFISKNFINDIQNLKLENYEYYYFEGLRSDNYNTYRLFLNRNEESWTSKLNNKDWLSKINKIYIVNDGKSKGEYYPQFSSIPVVYKNPDDFVSHFESHWDSK